MSLLYRLDRSLYRLDVSLYFLKSQPTRSSSRTTITPRMTIAHNINGHLLVPGSSQTDTTFQESKSGRAGQGVSLAKGD
jgi:hypothetical protein